VTAEVECGGGVGPRRLESVSVTGPPWVIASILVAHEPWYTCPKLEGKIRIVELKDPKFRKIASKDSASEK
jgi:hypothetical protein